MSDTKTLVFGLMDPLTEDERRRFSHLRGTLIVPFRGFFTRVLQPIESHDLNDIINYFKLSWQKTIDEFKRDSELRYESIMFDRATLSGFFVSCHIFDRVDYEAQFHKNWNMEESPDFDPKASYPQKLITCLIELICRSLLFRGGNLVMPISQLADETVNMIKAMFSESEIVSSQDALVTRVIMPSVGDPRDVRIMHFKRMIA